MIVVHSSQIVYVGLSDTLDIPNDIFKELLSHIRVVADPVLQLLESQVTLFDSLLDTSDHGLSL
jgi:hypothetical protein